MKQFITIILAAILFAGCSSNATAENNDSTMQSSKVTTSSAVTTTSSSITTTTSPVTQASVQVVSEVTTTAITTESTTQTTKKQFYTHFDEETRTLYYKIYPDHDKNAATRALMNYCFQHIVKLSEVDTIVVNLDKAISEGPTIVTFRKQINDNESKESTKDAIILVTNGTYKGYTGKVYEGEYDSSQSQNTINACKLIDENTLRCPDGDWPIVDYMNEKMLFIASRKDEKRYDSSIRHNGYRVKYNQTWIYKFTDPAQNFAYSSTNSSDPLSYDFTKIYATFSTWQEWLSYLKENKIVIFGYEAQGLYPEEIPPIDEDLVHCLYVTSNGYNPKDARSCPLYYKKNILSWSDEWIEQYK